MEHKEFPALATKIIDATQGIVEGIITVFGILDQGNDIAHPGSFKKTLTERGNKVRVLDSHRTDSVCAVLGVPLDIREIGKHELPADVLRAYPEATGGVYAKTQFLMDTPEGLGAFARIKAGALDEWSYGYDAVDTSTSTVTTKDGKEVQARNLKQIRLWEYSPVLWGLNPATAVVSAKADNKEPTESKPWQVFPVEDTFCVYQVDEEGQRVGEALGCHPTEAEAETQMSALYANEPDAGKQDGPFSCECLECGHTLESEEHCIDIKCPECGGEMRRAERPGKAKVTKKESDGQHPSSHYLVVEDSSAVTTWHLRVRDVDGDLNHNLMGAAWAALISDHRGNAYEGPGKTEAIAKLKKLYEQEEMDLPSEKVSVPDEEPEDKEGRVLARRNAERIAAALNRLIEVLEDAGVDLPGLGTDEKVEDAPGLDADDAPVQAAEDKQQDEQAGPDVEPPTSDLLLRTIEIELEEIELLTEV